MWVGRRRVWGDLSKYLAYIDTLVSSLDEWTRFTTTGCRWAKKIIERQTWPERDLFNSNGQMMVNDSWVTRQNFESTCSFFVVDLNDATKRGRAKKGRLLSRVPSCIDLFGSTYFFGVVPLTSDSFPDSSNRPWSFEMESEASDSHSLIPSSLATWLPLFFLISQGLVT